MSKTLKRGVPKRHDPESISKKSRGRGNSSPSSSLSDDEDEKVFYPPGCDKLSVDLDYIKTNVLSEYQHSVINEAIEKSNIASGMCIPVGGGKTLMAIYIALRQTTKRILFVCSKSLVGNCIFEVEKFFPSLRYEVLTRDVQKLYLEEWKPDKLTRLIITTPEIVQNSYTSNNLEKLYIYYTDAFVGNMQIAIKNYNVVTSPYVKVWLRGVSYVHYENWGCMIIDEAAAYTNCDISLCQGLASVCADTRWLLSGTMFVEPKFERILGYYLLSNNQFVPRNLPDFKVFISREDFQGINLTTISRDTNGVGDTYIVECITESHTLTEDEASAYAAIRETIGEIYKLVQRFKHTEGSRRFSKYLLPSIGYLRQALVCPLIPISSALIDASDVTNDSNLTKIFQEKLREKNLEEYISSKASAKSSRIRKILELLNRHSDTFVIVFVTYKMCLDLIMHFIRQEFPDRGVFTIESKNSSIRRAEIVDEFRKSMNGVMLLTYELGSRGLNLQFCYISVLVDYWWNKGMSVQAIGRTGRNGQLSDRIIVYLLTSNTGIEKAILEKQKIKETIISELSNGPVVSKVPTMGMKDIVNIINMSDNVDLLKDIYQS